MCFDPISAALVGGGGVAQAGASYLQAKNAQDNARRQEEARARARAAELQRQQGYQTENAQTFADTLGLFSPDAQGGSLASAVAQREKAFQDNLPQPSELPTSASTPNIVKTDRARAQKKADDFVAQQGNARARVEGMGDLLVGNQRGIATGARKVNTINNFAQSSAAINPAEQAAAAAKAYRPPGLLADLLGLTGAGSQLYGFMGAPGLRQPPNPFAMLPGWQQMGGR